LTFVGAGYSATVTADEFIFAPKRGGAFWMVKMRTNISPQIGALHSTFHPLKPIHPPNAPQFFQITHNSH
jgi:hypothetical protein